jgi:Zn-finger in ubiquitin-hydrolases and other protein/SnoaL-like polyketide cyclase
MTDGAGNRLQEFVDRLAAGDFESLREYLAAEFYASVPEPDEPPAYDRIADLVLPLKAAMPDLTVEIDAVTPTADGMQATMTVRGTHEHELWGVPGSGDVIEWTNPISIREVGDRFAINIDDTTTPQRVGLVRQLHLLNPADEMHLPPHFPVVWPEFLLKLIFTGAAGDRPCSHLDDIRVTEPTADVCQRCGPDGVWPALRMCLICGFVGCCDTSTHRHMAAHYQETGHPIFRSIRNEEGWIWCYEDDAFFERSTLERYRRS